MSRPKPQQMPFQQSGTTTNTFGYMAPDRFDPNVAAYLAAPLDVDPGVGRRADLAEQGLENRWNSVFASGIPEHVRMQQVDAGRRGLSSDAAAQAQQAGYIKNTMELGRRERLLPQLVQTGGTANSQGFKSESPNGTGFWGGFGSGLADGLLRFI